jgi:nicotinate-nucleotide pyrophosphorylase (carboxylating)
MWSPLTLQLIEMACAEDLGATGDLTSALLPAPAAPVTARVVPRRPGILCGLALGPAIGEVFSRRLGQPITFAPATASAGRPWADGDAVQGGETVATLHGPPAAVLSTERTLLNFLGRLSGVATLTRAYVDRARAANPRVAVLDTRKTLPGWRELDKYAVRAGGGSNHRAGLYDAVLIKDNHLAGIPIDRLAAELPGLLARVSGHVPPPQFVEVEVDSLAQLDQVLRVPGIDIILLDNFSTADLRAAVAARDATAAPHRPLLEASGGVTLDTIAAIAATGVDRVSVGALTHSAIGLDLGLDL